MYNVSATCMQYMYIGRGISKAKIFKGKFETKLEFPGGGGGFKPDNLPWGGMDIFWSHTIHHAVKMNFGYD